MEIDLAGVLRRTDTPCFLLNERGALVFTNEALRGRLAADPSDPDLWRRVAEELLALPADRAGPAPFQLDRPWADEWLRILFVPLLDPTGATFAHLGWVDAGPPIANVRKPSDGLLAERLERWRSAQRQTFGVDAVPARGDAMLRVLEQLRLAGAVSVPVAIVGPAGTGKLTLARVLHHLRFGNRGRCVVLDCPSVPGDLQRQELLGRADSPDRDSAEALGLLRAGGTGTLVLRRPRHLPADLQAAIVERVRAGDSKWRFVATEAGPLDANLPPGELTAPFFHLFSTLVISLPPLRHRQLEFADHCDQILVEWIKRTGQPKALEPAALEALRNYEWTGNLRELRTVLEQSAERAVGPTISRADLPRRVRKGPGVPPPAAALDRPPPPLDQLLEAVERRLLELALQHSAGNKSKAADFLRISRARLHRRLEQLGLAPPAAEETS